MDSNRFDDITKALATGTSRRKMVKGLLAGAAGIVGLRRVATLEAAPTCRALGEACQSDASCCPNSHLVCQQVAATGAHRCECDTAAGFHACEGVCILGPCCTGGTVACGGDCVTGECTGANEEFSFATCTCVCASGFTRCNATGECQANCTGGRVFTQGATSCTCECPVGTQECNGVCVTTTCSGGRTFNTSTCQCECPSGGVFCNGCCHDVTSACAGEHNKIFNVQCCSCENPGQPSGKCKGTPLTCA